MKFLMRKIFFWGHVVAGGWGGHGGSHEEYANGNAEQQGTQHQEHQATFRQAAQCIGARYANAGSLLKLIYGGFPGFCCCRAGFERFKPDTCSHKPEAYTEACA
jgi:hypothetical protein